MFCWQQGCHSNNGSPKSHRRNQSNIFPYHLVTRFIHLIDNSWCLLLVLLVAPVFIVGCETTVRSGRGEDYNDPSVEYFEKGPEKALSGENGCIGPAPPENLIQESRQEDWVPDRSYGPAIGDDKHQATRQKSSSADGFSPTAHEEKSRRLKPATKKSNRPRLQEETTNCTNHTNGWRARARV